ncbi:ran gtpase-activating protein 1 [Holotrichia oblita]|uniref:Ran gtpase-activating protein 1 n=1 Tax=Holotrichia oblita TaxID=644536 RepID=A0ACB9TYI8_HOLOL|nr:ran gtpase-activating protein 1 [Holotrichia oblita]
MVSIEDVTEALENTRVTISGVSFAGKSLKLDSENDAKPVVDAINDCADLQYLNLEAIFRKCSRNAGARLTELDLSDNAFGPIGVEGLASLLRSSSCYGLEELRKSEGKPLALKVFIAGRNRLENDGAKALAEVFNTIGTLEEIAMPQNGIYHIGISALSDAFRNNKNLQILNLNDNTIGPTGSKAIADILPVLQNLKEINFGDCLLKNDGAKHLATGLNNCMKLESLTLGFNEIKKDGALELIAALANKSQLKALVLDGTILEAMARKQSGKNDGNSHNQSRDDVEIFGNLSLNEKTVVVADFLNKPNADNFIALGPNVSNLLLSEAEKSNENQLEKLTEMLMKVGSLNVAIKGEENIQSVLKCTELLFEELVKRSQNSDSLSIMNNFLLVYLGFIKSEDKKFKPTWNIDGCLIALHNVVKKNYMPESTKKHFKSVYTEGSH